MLRLISAVALAAFVQEEYRILNGQKAIIQEYPFQASVLYGWTQIGAGAIISPKYILTAAHLIYGRESKQLQLARLPCIDRKICKEAWKCRTNGEIELGNHTLCAGGGTVSNYNGDSGGPLINDKKQLVGITSWGKNMKSLLGYPAVYVNLANLELQKYVYSPLNAQQ